MNMATPLYFAIGFIIFLAGMLLGWMLGRLKERGSQHYELKRRAAAQPRVGGRFMKKPVQQ